MGRYKYITINDKLKGFPFLRLPRVILQDEQLSLGAKILYALMLDRTDWALRQKRKRDIDELKRAHIVYPYGEMCKDLGITKNTAKKYLAQLQDAGLVVQQVNIGYCHSYYVLVSDDIIH
jgi:hypothetical protein